MKTALVLEGGAMRGLFSAGLIDRMMEEKISYDAMIGVSAGAAFGCNYKSRQIGRAIRYNCEYAHDWRYCSLRSLLLTGDIFGAKFCYETIPEELDPIDEEAFDTNPMKMIVVCTDVHTGRPVYKEINKLSDRAMEWTRGSASMPFLSHVVHVDGFDLLDGGISDSIPVKHMVEEGYEKIVVVLTRPDGYRKEAFGYDRLVRLSLHKYPHLAQAVLDRHRMYNKELAYIKNLEEEGRIFVIRPDEALQIGRIEHDEEILRQTHSIGYEKGGRIMQQLKSYLG